MAIETRDADARRLAAARDRVEQLEQRHAVPLGRAEQAEMTVLRVARALEQVRAKKTLALEDSIEAELALGVDQAVDPDPPRRARVQLVGKTRAHVEALVGRDQIRGVQRRQIGEQAAVEPDSERRFERRLAFVDERSRAERTRSAELLRARRARVLRRKRA